MLDSFSTRATLTIGERSYQIRSLPALTAAGFDLAALPYSLRVLLENVLRHEDGVTVSADEIHQLASWRPGGERGQIDFTPERVLLQDFTGVPALVDLAAMRDAMAELGGDPRRINPLQPVELVVDHSIQVDAYATRDAAQRNGELDYARNRERYAFLRWGQDAFRNFEVVPPHTGICHQVNLERLARVVFTSDEIADASDGVVEAYPDTLVGTDSHTTMINGLGVLGWGVGGIEAEAAMLGQPISMLIPEVIGVRLEGELRPGVTATDLVLTIAQRLRSRNVIGKLVEFVGPGLCNLEVPDRATISNMCPEFGATCAMFPIDRRTVDYLRLTGRAPDRLALIEGYARAQGLLHETDGALPRFSDLVELDLGRVEASVSGPRRPHDRVALSAVAASFAEALPSLLPPARAERREPLTGDDTVRDGSVVIAAITSCTNTSNPSVMLAAGLLARKAVELGLTRPTNVKTSLAPGSRVVIAYLERTGLLEHLERLGFGLVGYGCTTCIGNSGPLPDDVGERVERDGLVVCAVLSGNRNFEGRINPAVRANYLMSPPLVVAYALAGRIDLDLTQQPLGHGHDGRPVFLRDVWPQPSEVQAAAAAIDSEMFTHSYRNVFSGDHRWRTLSVPRGERFAWELESTYVRRPPYFDAMPAVAAETVADPTGLRVLCWLGDSVTTDHISPAGSIRADSPAGRYLLAQGIAPQDFNSYGARRGNHEVMMRGTFANDRIRNFLTPEREGGVTVHIPSGETLSIYDAAVRYRASRTPLLVIAGKEYGSGSSRDWAAKGPALLGVQAVLAESFERIHRSNLVGMGVLPLQFRMGDSAHSLGLRGGELFALRGVSRALATGFASGREVSVEATNEQGETCAFKVLVRIDTPQEILYYRHGGVLPYVLRQLLAGHTRPEAVPGGLAAAHLAEPGVTPAPEMIDESVEESFPASDPPSY